MPRALLSVHDKTGVVDLARRLSELGWELVSTGGTARAIRDAGLPVVGVEEVTGVPEMLDGRVKTLHPDLLGGILADRDRTAHVAELAAAGIEPVDLVVVNLYPFASDPSIELIDVGGPTMVRAAAKAHAHVTVIVDPGEYPSLLDELSTRPTTTPETRRRLARSAFAHTAAYDAAIAAWLDEPTSDAPPVGERPAASLGLAPTGLAPTGLAPTGPAPTGPAPTGPAPTGPAPTGPAPTGPAPTGPAPTAPAAGPSPLPKRITFELERAQDLRYGENPHQPGARYRTIGARSWWDDAIQLQGKQLSYLNLHDTEAAWRLVHEIGGPRPAAVVVKHANPCGAARHDDLRDAYVRARDADPTSAFGGVVALAGPVDERVAEALSETFLEVVIAPSFEPAAVEVLATRANLRLLAAPAPGTDPWHLRPLHGGLLVQPPDRVELDHSNWKVVSRRQPTEAEWSDMELAWIVVARVTSNAIVLAADGAAVGIGAGQQSRVDASRIAADKAAGRAEGGACASDAFFPFRDGVDAAAAAGVGAVIQPGGSVRDAEVIAAADEHGLALVHTGRRHFRH